MLRTPLLTPARIDNNMNMSAPSSNDNTKATAMHQDMNCWEAEDGGEVGAHGQLDLRPAVEVPARQGGRGGTDADCILNLCCTQAVLRIPPHVRPPCTPPKGQPGETEAG